MSIINKAVSAIKKVIGPKTLNLSNLKGSANPLASSPKPNNPVFKARVGEGLTPSQTSNAYSTISKPTAQLPTSRVGQTLASGGLPGAARAVEGAGTVLGSSISKGVNAIKRVANKANSVINDYTGSAGGGSSLAADSSQINPFSSTTYKGRPATEQSSFSIGGGSAMGQSLDNQPLATVITPQEREGKRNFVQQEEQKRTTLLNQKQQEAQAKRAAIDANAAAVVAPETNNPEDPFLLQLQEDAKRQEREYEKLQKDIEELSQPSAEVSAAQEEENRLITQEHQINADLNQKVTDVGREPIPQGFVQGWGNTFNKDANAKLQTIAAQKVPIQMKLASMQAKRQAAMDVVKSRQGAMGNRSDKASDRLYNYQDDERKRKQKALDPYTLSEGQTRYDPLTGTSTKAPKTYKATTPRASNYSPSQLKPFIATGERNLNASRGEDGYVDPAVYQQAYDQWLKYGLGSLKEFKAKFPPGYYVNPANATLPLHLRETPNSSSSTPTVTGPRTT